MFTNRFAACAVSAASCPSSLVRSEEEPAVDVGLIAAPRFVLEPKYTKQSQLKVSN